MSNVTLHLGDCVKWAREYSGEPFHALLCDPPYHLTSITQRVGPGKSEVGDIRGPNGPFKGLNRGFMGKQWDGGDVAFDPATWEAFGRIMYPGAFGMAFASSRGWHRLACAIEDAGFVIHPSLFGWAYGSGFPKATRVDTQIDREAGVEFDRVPAGGVGMFTKSNGKGGRAYKREDGGWNETKARLQRNGESTPLAAAFAGHRYGLQALKPALEPIIVFQKPYAGRPIDNITATGAGCLAIDAARIDAGSRPLREHDNELPSNGVWGEGLNGSRAIGETTQGRWPANFYLGSEEAAARLDEQSGTTVSTANVRHNGEFKSVAKGYELPHDTYGHADSGGASRFFFTVREQLDDADPVRYVAKASRRERDAGLEGMPMQSKPSGGHGNKEDDPISIAMGSLREFRNPHPTVKPLALARYLATLLLPPAEYAPRRLFVPFAGVASECIGAMQAGWEDVQGVELTEEYIPIAQARVEYWKSKGVQMEFK